MRDNWNPAFFSDPKQLERLLEKHKLGRVMLDTRALCGGDPSHPDVVKELQALMIEHRKQIRLAD